MALSILRLLLIRKSIKMEKPICLCDTCPYFCVDNNFDNYLCKDCDPYAYDYNFDDEGDDEYE